MVGAVSEIKQILVVDDDTAMILLLRDFLKGQGYSVATSTSVIGALGWLNSLPNGGAPEIIISDVRLGSASGIDLASRLAVERPTVPIVLFSVFEGHEKEALRSGARKFLRKPFPLSTLAELLREEFKLKPRP